jgi:hypothetical protein
VANCRTEAPRRGPQAIGFQNSPPHKRLKLRARID